MMGIDKGDSSADAAVAGTEIKDYPQVSCLIVTYQSERVIKACINALVSTTYPPNLEILVWDNSSTDGTRQALSGMEGIRFFAASENLGFAAAANRLASQARGQLLFLLNPDCLVSNDTLARLIELEKENPNVVAVGPVIASKEGSRLAGAGREPTLRRLLGEIVFLPFLTRSSRGGVFVRRSKLAQGIPISVDWLAGTALLIRSDAFRDLGGFDEQYFMYCEDMDLGGKIRQAGRVSLLHTGLTVAHIGGSSHASRSSAIHLQKSSLLLYLSRTGGKRNWRTRLVQRVLVTLYILERRALAVIRRTARDHVERDR